MGEELTYFLGIGGVINAVVLLEGSPAWTSDIKGNFQKWLAQYLNWLLTSPLGKGEDNADNNHGIWYIVTFENSNVIIC